MSTPIKLVKTARQSRPPPSCPLRPACNSAASGAAQPANDTSSDAQYVRARRQGLYLAACIVDEVDALGKPDPQAVIDEIRRRLSDLVRVELNSAEPLMPDV